jgi:lysophospholipase L1-like esterase
MIKGRKGLVIGLSILVVTAVLGSFASIAFAQPTATSFGVEDAEGYPDTHVLIPVNITNVQNGPVPTIIFNILYNNSVINVTEVQKGTLTSNWDNPNYCNHDWGTSVVIYTSTDAYAVQNGLTGSVALLNFSVIGEAGATSVMDLSNIQLAEGAPDFQVGTAPANNGTFTVLHDDLNVVSCLGDSITNGYPYAGTENTYPARLQAILDTAYGSGSYEVINHGVDGYRADQVLADLQNLNWLAQDNPDVVLLMVGGNDLSQEATPLNLFTVINQTVAEVQDIVDLVTTHTNPDGSHPRIIVSAFTPVQDTLECTAVKLYNNRQESDLTGMDLWFTDNWDDFYNPDTGHARASLMADNVHPNADRVIQSWM